MSHPTPATQHQKVTIITGKPGFHPRLHGLGMRLRTFIPYQDRTLDSSHSLHEAWEPISHIKQVHCLHKGEKESSQISTTCSKEQIGLSESGLKLYTYRQTYFGDVQKWVGVVTWVKLLTLRQNHSNHHTLTVGHCQLDWLHKPVCPDIFQSQSLGRSQGVSRALVSCCQISPPTRDHCDKWLYPPP